MIYVDNAASTPLSETARRVYGEISANVYGNPSSGHRLGISAEHAIRDAGCILSGLLGCMPEEIIFTSGATESNNLALLGATRRFIRRGGHILTAPLEHPSVSQPLHFLSGEGFRVTVASPSDWARLVTPDTVLASFAQVNNETGDINDVAAITQQIKLINPQTILHVDGSQGFCKDSASLALVDLYSFSAHKIHGPKGVGGLMARKSVRLAPLMYGGSQQNGLRSGTENTAGICAMAAAAQEISQQISRNYAHVSVLYAILSELASEILDVFINRYGDTASPYILNMSFIGLRGETLVHMLSERGICIATGAACRTRKAEASPLHALGYDEARVGSAVRFSFSPDNTIEETHVVKSAVRECVLQLRAMQAKQYRRGFKTTANKRVKGL